MFPLAEKLARRIGVAASSASIAVAAISPAQAAAPTWIKATFAGTATDNSAGTVVTSFTDWTFYIYNYALDSTSTSSYASATQPSTVQGNSVGYNPPLFGFGSFTGNGFTGQYNAYGAPDTSQPPSPTGYDRIVFDQNASRQIRFNTGRLNTSSGIKFTNSNKTYDVNFIAFSEIGRAHV